MNDYPKSVAANALALIGNTPLISLSRVFNGTGRLLAKVEFMQPGGSVKDRAALRIIEDAYADGRLVKGRSVVEMTSGNMGAGLAVVCNVFGNPFTAVMSEGNSPARARALEALGAEVVLIPQVDGKPSQVTGADIEASVVKAIELAKNKDAFYVDQFNNPSSVLAHEHGTGPEIWDQTGGALDAFVTAVGSGGTFIGVSKFLKSRNPDIHCCAVEPYGTQVLAGKSITDPKHLIQGIGYSLIPPHFDPALCDSTMPVTDAEALATRDNLASREGLHVGFSAAANVRASIKLIESGRLGNDPCVVTVLCDTGLKY
jgi:cysteine synthase